MFGIPNGPDFKSELQTLEQNYQACLPSLQKIKDSEKIIQQLGA